jgi:two-component sensor histidine kinase
MSAHAAGLSATSRRLQSIAPRRDIILDVTSSVQRMELNRLLTVSLVVEVEAIAGTSDLLLSVGDNGPGFAADFDPAQSDRLGFRILKSFARSLDGTLSFRNQNGAITEIRFPAQAPA